MRDGIKLATDLYLPPDLPAPAVGLRTPYGREDPQFHNLFYTFASRGFAFVSQDCRGTGQSEPEFWDYYIYEEVDGPDLVDWVTKQVWCDGFFGSLGSSYAGQTQWGMGLHPRMSAIAPEVSGLGFARNTVRHHMFMNVHATTTGRSSLNEGRSFAEIERSIWDETLRTGFLEEPLVLDLASESSESQHNVASGVLEELEGIWARYCRMSPAGRANLVKSITRKGMIDTQDIETLAHSLGKNHDSFTIPSVDSEALCARLKAPALMITGWYDWALNDSLATWEALQKYGSIGKTSRLIITPSSHNKPGYHEGKNTELLQNHRFYNHIELLMRWYDTVRAKAFDEWPNVVYYLMGQNEWRTASSWPPLKVANLPLYLRSGGHLSIEPPSSDEEPDQYEYDPFDPTPTLGGNIVSYVLTPGSVDVQELHTRADVLTYTSHALSGYTDIAGPLSVLLFVNSSAIDTDFCVRLTDVFPDGRAIQLQSNILRARYRECQPQFMSPETIYPIKLDLWATANRFKQGHRLRIDICSSDFPKFERNNNLGDQPGRPMKAMQTIYHDKYRASCINLPILETTDSVIRNALQTRDTEAS